jgi:hypothetical protein
VARDSEKDPLCKGKQGVALAEQRAIIVQLFDYLRSSYSERQSRPIGAYFISGSDLPSFNHASLSAAQPMREPNK